MLMMLSLLSDYDDYYAEAVAAEPTAAPVNARNVLKHLERFLLAVADSFRPILVVLGIVLVVFVLWYLLAVLPKYLCEYRCLCIDHLLVSNRDPNCSHREHRRVDSFPGHDHIASRIRHASQARPTLLRRQSLCLPNGGGRRGEGADREDPRLPGRCHGVRAAGSQKHRCPVSRQGRC